MFKSIAASTLAVSVAIFGATEEHGFQGIGRDAAPAPVVRAI